MRFAVANSRSIPDPVFALIRRVDACADELHTFRPIGHGAGGRPPRALPMQQPTCPRRPACPEPSHLVDWRRNHDQVRAGSTLLMTNYTRPDEGVPYDDGVLNWVVCSHREMGFKSGEWLGNELRARGKLEPKIVVLQGPAASEISE